MRNSLLAPFDGSPAAVEFRNRARIDGERDKLRNQLGNTYTALGSAAFEQRRRLRIDFDRLRFRCHAISIVPDQASSKPAHYGRLDETSYRRRFTNAWSFAGRLGKLYSRSQTWLASASSLS